MKNVEKFKIDAWIKDFSTHLAKESIKLLAIQGATKGNNKTVKDLKASFVQAIVDELITRALQEKPEGILTYEQNYEFSKKNFLESRLAVQEAVAQGLSDAAYKFSNIRVEYHCDIKVIGDSKSKVLN